MLLLTFNCGGVLQAQYNSTDFLEVGDSILLSTTGAGLLDLDIDTAGTAVLWDFSSLEAQSQTLNRFSAAESFGYRFAWCLENRLLFTCNEDFDNLTNMGVSRTDTITIGGFGTQNSVDHYKKTSDAFVLTMTAFEVNIGLPLPLINEYVEKDTLYRFPVVFGDEYETTNLVSNDLTALGVPFKNTRRQIKQHRVDGQGTLVTPFGTYTDVVRLKVSITTYDTTFLDTLVTPIITETVEYKWFSPQLGYPVCEAFGNVLLGDELITSMQYIDSSRCIAPRALFGYFPIFPEIDSSSGVAEVSLINRSANSNSYEWDFGNGAGSMDPSPVATFNCEGQAIISLIAGNSCNLDLLDTLLLPIFIGDASGVVQIDTSLFFSGDTIFTNDIGFDEIAWIDCETDEVMDTGNSFFIPPVEGTYRAEIKKFNCTKSSACVQAELSTSTYNGEAHTRAYSVYPNPVSNSFEVVPKGNIKSLQLIDFQGRVIQRYSRGDDLAIPAGVLAGIYLLRMEESDGKVFYVRVIKH